MKKRIHMFNRPFKATGQSAGQPGNRPVSRSTRQPASQPGNQLVNRATGWSTGNRPVNRATGRSAGQPGKQPVNRATGRSNRPVDRRHLTGPVSPVARSPVGTSPGPAFCTYQDVHHQLMGFEHVGLKSIRNPCASVVHMRIEWIYRCYKFYRLDLFIVFIDK